FAPPPRPGRAQPRVQSLLPVALDGVATPLAHHALDRVRADLAPFSRVPLPAIASHGVILRHPLPAGAVVAQLRRMMTPSFHFSTTRPTLPSVGADTTLDLAMASSADLRNTAVGDSRRRAPSLRAPVPWPRLLDRGKMFSRPASREPAFPGARAVFLDQKGPTTLRR